MLCFFVVGKILYFLSRLILHLKHQEDQYGDLIEIKFGVFLSGGLDRCEPVVVTSWKVEATPNWKVTWAYRKIMIWCSVCFFIFLKIAKLFFFRWQKLKQKGLHLILTPANISWGSKLGKPNTDLVLIFCQIEKGESQFVLILSKKFTIYPNLHNNCPPPFENLLIFAGGGVIIV